MTISPEMVGQAIGPGVYLLPGQITSLIFPRLGKAGRLPFLRRTHVIIIMMPIKRRKSPPTVTDMAITEDVGISASSETNITFFDR